MNEKTENEQDDKRQAWRYAGGQWLPSDSFIECEEHGDWNKAMRAAGYLCDFRLNGNGDIEGSLTVVVWSWYKEGQASKSVMSRPPRWLLEVWSGGEGIGEVYVDHFPDFVDVMSKFSSMALAALLSDVYQDLGGALEVLTRPAKREHEREEEHWARERERRARATREGQ